MSAELWGDHWDWWRASKGTSITASLDRAAKQHMIDEASRHTAWFLRNVAAQALEELRVYTLEYATSPAMPAGIGISAQEMLELADKLDPPERTST